MVIAGVEESCDEVRRRAATARNDGALATPLRDHVLGCEACAEWLAGLPAPAPAADPDAARAFAATAAAMGSTRPVWRGLPPLVILALAAALAWWLPQSLSRVPFRMTQHPQPRVIQEPALARARAELTRVGVEDAVRSVLGEPTRRHGGDTTHPGRIATDESVQLMPLGPDPDLPVPERILSQQSALRRVRLAIGKCSVETRLGWLFILGTPQTPGILNGSVAPEMRGELGRELAADYLRQLIRDAARSRREVRLQVLMVAAGSADLPAAEREEACRRALELRWQLLRESPEGWAHPIWYAPPAGFGFCGQSACRSLNGRAWWARDLVKVALARLLHGYRAGGASGVMAVVNEPGFGAPLLLLGWTYLLQFVAAALCVVWACLALLAWWHRASLRTALAAASEREHRRARAVSAALLGGFVLLPAYFGGLAWWLALTNDGATQRWRDLRVFILEGWARKFQPDVLLAFLALLGAGWLAVHLHDRALRAADPSLGRVRSTGVLFVPVVIAMLGGASIWDRGVVLIPLMLAGALLLAGRALWPVLSVSERLLGMRTVVGALNVAAVGVLTRVLIGTHAADLQSFGWVAFVWGACVAVPAACGYVRAHLSPASLRRARWLTAAVVLSGPLAVLLLGARIHQATTVVPVWSGTLTVQVALLLLTAFSSLRLGERSAPETAGAVA